jgi:hypothetical protein
MQTEPTKTSEAMQRKAEVCETIAQDKTEESLTGDSCDKEKNKQDAEIWRSKSEVWLEAEAITRAGISGQPPPANRDVTPGSKC